MELPTGSILLWFGSIASIPAGWTLCDGTLGTPDLRNVFVIGAGDTYAVDDTGGGLTHTHTFTSNGHTHGWIPGVGIATGSFFEDVSSSSSDSGTTGANGNLPPYHALAYIMKT